MNLLSELLPGLRAARSSLFVGYLYLLTAWLAFGDRIPEREELERGSVGDLVAQAAEFIGPGGTAFAVSVVAYLLGSIQNDVFGTGVDFITHRSRSEVPPAETVEWVAGQSVDTLEASTDTGKRALAESTFRVEVGIATFVLSTVLMARQQPAWSLITGSAAALLMFHGFLIMFRITREQQAVARRFVARSQSTRTDDDAGDG